MITVQYPLTRTSFQKEGYCCNHTATICYLLEGTTGLVKDIVAVADIWFFIGNIQSLEGTYIPKNDGNS